MLRCLNLVTVLAIGDRSLMSRLGDFPCVQDIQMKREVSDSTDEDEPEPSKMRRVRIENADDADVSVVTSFSVTCEIIDIHNNPNERAHLKFTVIPRVASSPLSNVTSIPSAFRTNCLNQYPGFRTKPIYVGLLPYVHSSDELTMEYVGPVTNEETQEVGNVVLRQLQEHGGWYSQNDPVMHDEFHAYRQQFAQDSADRFEHYKNSYSAMVGHTLVIKLSNTNFERITAISGLLDSVIANAVVGVYARIGEVLDYYEQQFSNRALDRKVGWITQFGDVSMERSTAQQSSFYVPGLLNQTICDHVAIHINKFSYQGVGVFYVVGEYIHENSFPTQRDVPEDQNDLYSITSTGRIQLPFPFYAPSFAWPVTPNTAGASS